MTRKKELFVYVKGYIIRESGRRQPSLQTTKDFKKYQRTIKKIYNKRTQSRIKKSQSKVRILNFAGFDRSRTIRDMSNIEREVIKNLCTGIALSYF